MQIICSFIRNHSTMNLHTECRNIQITCTSKIKFPRKLLNLKNVYKTKQSRTNKLVPFIWSQNPHRLFPTLVSNCFIECALCFSFLTLCFNIYKTSFLPSLYVWSCVIAKIKSKIQNFSVFLVFASFLAHKM